MGPASNFSTAWIMETPQCVGGVFVVLFVSLLTLILNY